MIWLSNLHANKWAHPTSPYISPTFPIHFPYISAATISYSPCLDLWLLAGLQAREQRVCLVRWATPVWRSSSVHAGRLLPSLSFLFSSFSRISHLLPFFFSHLLAFPSFLPSTLLSNFLWTLLIFRLLVFLTDSEKGARPSKDNHDHLRQFGRRHNEIKLVN